MEKTKKTYNEQLNQAGDAAFIMKKHIDKDNNIKKAFIFCPAGKVSALISLLDSKGGDNARVQDSLGDCLKDSMVLIRNNNICGVVSGTTVFYGDYKNQGYTARGLRLNEKHIEGLMDYIKTYGKVGNPALDIDSALHTIADSFKTSAAALTIDDLLAL